MTEVGLPALFAPAGAAFMLALLGGAHCAGMCGGFVGALQVHRARTVAPHRFTAAYHTGRLASYAAAGALVGTLGGALFAAEVLPLQIALLCVGSVMLLAVGATLFGRTGWLRRLEPLGVAVWRLVGPLARRLFPPRTPLQALGAGLTWGWIPCGMVYGALPLALSAGSPAAGALVMLAFGAGTLPNLLAVDFIAGRLVRDAGATAGRPTRVAALMAWARPLAGAAIAAFGVSGLAHAARVAGAQHPAIDALASICHHL
jgi:uncharacterized protein